MIEERAKALLNTISSIRVPSALWRFAVRGLTDLGFPCILYHYVGVPGTRAGQNVFAYGMPKRWREEYLGDSYAALDPVLDLAEGRALPFYWCDMSERPELPPAQIAYLKRLRQSEIGDGLTLALYGPMGQNAYLHLGFRGPRRALSHADLFTLQMLGTAGHLRYCAMLRERFQVVPKLTPREREILEWISRGKSNSVIADILGISGHTVDTTLRRLFAKIGVSDRTTAAVRALSMGLIEAGRIRPTPTERRRVESRLRPSAIRSAKSA